jgi:hypothetical protein
MRRRDFLAAAAAPAPAPKKKGWRALFNGRNLDGWEPRGNGIWLVWADGTLAGQRHPRRDYPTQGFADRAQYQAWLNTQAWLYSKEEFGEYDLHLDYWLPEGGNSGVSLRDPSRAAHAIVTPPDFRRTPSKLGYEIQLNHKYPDEYPSGSIYTFVKAKTGVQKDGQWNALDIEVRGDRLAVKLNGVMVAESATDPPRPKRGPVGLQLHDQFSFALFRNIRIRELK